MLDGDAEVLGFGVDDFRGVVEVVGLGVVEGVLLGVVLALFVGFAD